MPHVDTPTSRCLLGVARGDITPPVGIYHRMWGAASHDRSTGIHRPLTATALVFQAHSAEGEQVLLAVDHCLFGAQVMDALLASVCSATGLASEQFVVAFSHTHGAGLMGLDRVQLPGGDLIPPYLASLGVRLGELTQRARESIQPVVITYGVGRCNLAANRDFWDEKSGQFVCGYHPEGPADDTVVVARITHEAGQLLATVVNYACHPTTLAWDNTLISPDYPGPMRDLIEQVTGAPCVFLQGASGDLGPRVGFVGDVEVAERNGRQLGYAALSTLEALPPPATRFEYTGPVISGATIGTWKHLPLDATQLARKALWKARRWTVDLPYRVDLPTLQQTQTELLHWQSEEQAARAAGDLQKASDCRAMVERHTRMVARLKQLPPGETFPMPVTLWKIGDAFWLAVEGELYQEFQRVLRARFPGVPIVVMTLANGSRPAYLPTAETYGKGIYQESIAMLAQGSLERLIDAVGNEMARE